MSYDPTTPRVVQDDSWSCSCATTAWLLQSVGVYAPYPTVENEMVTAGLVTHDLGLLVGSAGPLTSWVESHYGVPAGLRPAPVGWDWLRNNAGYRPMAIGSGNWYHWSGVRGVNADGNLLLANPADGWKGVHQEMTQQQFRDLGPFTAWWIDIGEAEDVGKIEELISKLGYLQGDVADALQQGLDGAKAAKTAKDRKPAFDAIAAAIDTLRRGG